MFKRNPSHRPSATTLLSRGSLARLVRKCLPPEIITEYGEQELEETKNSKHSTPRKKADPSRSKIALENEATTMPREEEARKYSHTNLENINKNSVESALGTSSSNIEGLYQEVGTLSVSRELHVLSRCFSH